MAVIDDREDIIRGILIEENRTRFNEQESLKNGLEFSKECLHNSLLARMDAAYALQEASAIRLSI